VDGLGTIAGADANAPVPEPSDTEVRAELARILRSDRFVNAPSLSRFLSHIVDRTLNGNGNELKEYALGIDVFDRGEAFDPKIDTIVRVQARRLRSKLQAYYGAEGRDDTVAIELTKGRYAPEFTRRSPFLSRPSFRTVLPDIKLLRRATEETEEATPAAATQAVRRGRLVAGLVITAAVVVAAFWLIDSRRGPVTEPAEYTQITDFTDFVTAPALSQDGRMVAFIRDGDAFLSRGQIYVKALPNGQPVQVTSSENRKFAPVFTPDGSRVAYTEVRLVGNDTVWDTWTVPVFGGESSRFLPNASGLVWLDPLTVMFSEFRGNGGHLGIVTATNARAGERVIYFPAHERGMAHYSYPSPNRQSVIVVEMDRAGTFQSCRLVPFDGSSSGELVGPPGHCRSAAWSPDGKWMYFSVDLAGHSHLWRQAYGKGQAEQITFGPTEEEGVAIAPDGRSLITSIGQRQSAIWIHDGSGDRPLSTDGFAYAPRLSRDGRRVYYLFHESSQSALSDLRSMDLSSGKVETLLPDLLLLDHDGMGPEYDISGDEQEAVFASREPDGSSRIWVARLDRRTAPKEIARDGDLVSFGARNDVFFVTLGQQTSYFTRIQKDGSKRERVSALSPIHSRGGISPDGDWAVLYSPATSADAPPGTVAVPIRGGRAKRICTGLCWAWWSADGRFLFVSVFDASSPERTLVIPLAPGVVVPDLPESGLNVPANQSVIPGIRVIERGQVVPGPDPSMYVFAKTEFRRNLYRVPVH
jgi:Tol biopolymer transport system component